MYLANGAHLIATVAGFAQPESFGRHKRSELLRQLQHEMMTRISGELANALCCAGAASA